MGLEVTEDAQRSGRRLGRRQPAGADPRRRRRGICRRCCCAPIWTRSRWRPRSSRCVVDGYWENANDGILGADNKSAVATILELARRFTGGGGPPPVGIELLFTVCEEVSLRGSREFDVSQLQSALRLRVRSRHADRRGRRRLPDPLPDHRRAARPRRPRRRAARDRPQRGGGRGPGDRRDAARPPRRRDDRQRRHDRGRHGDQRRPRALPGRGRGAQPGRASGPRP